MISFLSGMLELKSHLKVDELAPVKRSCLHKTPPQALMSHLSTLRTCHARRDDQSGSPGFARVRPAGQSATTRHFWRQAPRA